jgi:protein-disulfide isomerase
MRVAQRPIILTILALLTLGSGAVVWAQPETPTPDELQTLRKEIQALKEGQQAIQNNLKAIKELLTARQRPRSNIQDVKFTVNVAKDPAKGPSDAKVTLIEFTDYQCPYCVRHTKTVLPQLTKDFIDTGKIRYVLRDFPLSSIHKDAAKAHEAAHCAGEQGKYWEMHDQLFAHPKALQSDKLAGHAKTAGVADAPAFQACVDSAKYEEQSKASVAEGTKVGVRGTPSFLLGLTEADGMVKATKLIRGAQPYSVFQQQINVLLAPPKSEGGPQAGTDG